MQSNWIKSNGQRNFAQGRRFFMNQMECLTKCLESLTKSLERYRLMKDVFADLVNYQLKPKTQEQMAFSASDGRL